MKIINGLETEHGLSLALGFFDGVHLGHAVVIKNAVTYAAENSVKSGIILFKSRPKEILSKETPEYIIPVDDKLNMLNKMGIDNVYLLDFDYKFANLSPEKYMEDIILKYFKPSAITTGYNHTFGKKGEGDSKLLEKYANDYNFKYFNIPPVTADNHDISSSVIKDAIKHNLFSLVKDLLGYYFYIKSPVVHGKKIGRTINYPTANLIYPENIVRVEPGVYYVYVNTGDNTYRGIMNYGYRPTVDKDSPTLIPEVHLLDFNGNLYGKIIKVSFVEKIREERPFKNLEELKAQLDKDSLFAKQYPYEK